MVGPKEPAEGVLLHQGVDPLLGQVKGRSGDIHKVPEGHVLGEVVNVHLWKEEVTLSVKAGKARMIKKEGSTDVRTTVLYDKM